MHADDAAEGSAGAAGAVYGVACAAFSLFHLYTSFHGPFDPLVQRGVFIGGGVLLAFWMKALGARRPLSRIVFILLGLAGAYGGLHVVLNNARFMDVMSDMRP